MTHYTIYTYCITIIYVLYYTPDLYVCANLLYYIGYMLGIRNVEYREKALLEMKRLLTSDGLLGVFYLLFSMINIHIVYIPCTCVYSYTLLYHILQE